MEKDEIRNSSQYLWIWKYKALTRTPGSRDHGRMAAGIMAGWQHGEESRASCAGADSSINCCRVACSLLRTHKATPRKDGLPLAGLWSSWPTLQVWVQGGKRRKENKPWQGIGRQVWKDFHRFGMLSCSRSLKSKLRATKEKRTLLILIKRRLGFLPPGLPFWTLFLISSFSKKKKNIPTSLLISVF